MAQEPKAIKGSRTLMDHKNNFDATRLVAAATVIYGHAHPLDQVPDVGFLGNSVEAFAVKVFFVISGYLICASWLSDEHVGRYLQRRVLRIIPALVLTVLLTIFVLGPMVSTLSMGTYFGSAGTWRYLWNIPLRPVYDLPGVFTDNLYRNAVNGSLWSLPAEFFMYLLMPVVLMLSTRLRNRWFFAAFTVVATLFAIRYLRVEAPKFLLVPVVIFLATLLRLRWFFVVFTFVLTVFALFYVRIDPPAFSLVVYGTSLRSTLDVAPYFLIGACFYLFRDRLRPDAVVALLLIGLVLLIQPSGILAELALLTVAPYAILAFATANTPVIRSAGRFGDISYGLYLYGFPVQQAVYHFFQNDLDPIRNTLISLPIAAALAFVSWHAVERRALGFKPRTPIPTPIPIPTIEPA